MLIWLEENIGSAIAVILLIAVVAAIITKIVVDKKKGKSNCGCNCAGCAMSEQCNKKH
ncbi:MAG: FeoB-associated Cys-rich membrane protein [Clostridia bacterium]|nr:FeoB-associated Cys-rich membrane protein [Clostridia bacterium]